MTTLKKFYNILVAGQTGAGKSSLINYLIGEKRAAAGVGQPVTSKDEFLSYQMGTSKIIFFDSWGIETDKVEDWTRRIEQHISTCDNSLPQEEGASWFHTVLYCIPCGNGRVQDLDRSMIRFFKGEGYSVIVVLTKADLAGDQDIDQMANVIPPGILPIAMSSGGADRYGINPPFGKRELFIAIVQSAATNLPERLRHFSLSLISRWKLHAEVALKGQASIWWGNSDLEQRVSERVNQFIGMLNQRMSCFIADEISIINSILSTPPLGKTKSIHISPPPSPELSSLKTNLFSPLTISGAIVYYSIFHRKSDRKAKLSEMISIAAEKLQELADDYARKLQEFADDYAKKIQAQLKQEDIKKVIEIDYRS